MPNPTDSSPSSPLAFALQAEEGRRAEAVRLTARGHGLLAEQILAIAFAQGVRVHKDAALASILDAIELDSPIPTAALAALAEILTRLHAENARAAATAAASPIGPAEGTPDSWT